MAIFHKILVALNVLIGIFSLVVIIGSSITIAQYNDADTLFSRGDFAWLLVGGILGLIVSVIGCLGSSDPLGKYNLLFCYFFLLSVILTFFSVGFYLYRVFVLDLEAAADGDVESAFRLESAKEFNDLLVSVYITCCTGCVTAIDITPTNCFAERAPEFQIDGNNVCVAVQLEELDGSEAPGTCQLPSVCNDAQRAVNEGLDQGCIINSAVVPSYSLGDNFCNFFSDFATDDDGNDIVGSLEENGCGRGSPKEFVEKVGQFVGKNYILIAISWGLGNVFLFLAWLGALFMLLCPQKFEEWMK